MQVLRGFCQCRDRCTAPSDKFAGRLRSIRVNPLILHAQRLIALSLVTHMLQQSTLHGQLHLHPTCSHQLRARGLRPGVCRLEHSLRSQAKRGARSSVKRDAQSFNTQSQQSSENFRDSAQEKAQAASKEASKRYSAMHTFLALLCKAASQAAFELVFLQFTQGQSHF